MAASELTRALERTDRIEIAVMGRRTGRKIAHTVWFVLEGSTLYLLPVRGSDGEWYRNVLEHPTIVVSARGTRLSATAIPITDRARVRDVVEKFRAKHGADDVKKYYTKFDVAVEVDLG
jgi:hypothetical protein